METVCDYLFRLSCCAVIAAFLLLVGGVVVMSVLNVIVRIPWQAFASLWVCVFVAFELLGFWKDPQ